jgi:hypothetical protein
VPRPFARAENAEFTRLACKRAILLPGSGWHAERLRIQWAHASSDQALRGKIFNAVQWWWRLGAAVMSVE